MKNKGPSLLMAAVLLCLSACSQAPEERETENAAVSVPVSSETEAPAQTEEIMPDLPAKDFGGDNFVFISPILTGDMADANTRDIIAEEETGENLNDAVFRRNAFLTDTCNVVIEEAKSSDTSADIRKSVAAQDGAYDVSYALVSSAMDLARKGNFLNYAKLDYIDFSRPWWDSNAASSLEIGGKSYYAVNDIMLSNNDATSAVLFNKKLIEDYGFTENMYDLVRGEKWTPEKVSEMSSVVYSDTDGNGVMDEHDLYGFMGYRDASLSLFHSSGGRIAEKTPDGGIELTLMKETTYDALIGALSLMAEPSTFNLHKVLEPRFAGSIYPIAEDMFRNNQGLFYWILIHDVPKFRDMEADFGILPVPSRDPSLTGYGCNVNQYHGHLMSIVTTADPDQAAYVTELMAAKSHYTVQEEYYNICLARKYSRDEESREMLDLIFSNRVYDIGAYYQIGSFSWNIISLTMTDSTDAASMYQKSQKIASKEIERILKDYSGLE